MANSKKNLVILAAGGTGGHIFPAIAFAEFLHGKQIKTYLLTDIRGTKYSSHFPFPYKIITSKGFAGSILKKVNFTFCTLLGLIQTLIFFSSHRCKWVIAFGGYPTFPILLASILFRKKIILHEQNSVLGKVNKLFYRFATHLAHGLPPLTPLPKSVYTGNPVRKQFSEIQRQKEQKHQKINLFVTGGSQGAKSFTDIIPKAFQNCSHKCQQKFHIIIQVPEASSKGFVEQMNTLEATYDHSAFFDDLPQKLSDSDVVISRAGASSITEILFLQKPAIFIPYPYATDNHQYYNAKPIADIDGGWILKENSDIVNSLSQILTDIADNQDILVEKAKNLQSLKIDNSADSIFNLMK